MQKMIRIILGKRNWHAMNSDAVWPKWSALLLARRECFIGASVACKAKLRCTWVRVDMANCTMLSFVSREVGLVSLQSSGYLAELCLSSQSRPA